MDGDAGRLVPELLVEIFSYLRKQDKVSCSQVCRSWYTANGVPSLWRDEEARLDLDRLSPDMVRSLEQRRVGRVVVIGGCSGKALGMLLEGHPSMEYLEFKFSTSLHFSHAMQGVDGRLPCLKTLKIKYCERLSLWKALDAFFQCADHLENLTLVRESGPCGDSLCARYGSRLRKLKRLTLHTNMLSDNGIKLLTGALPPNASYLDASTIEHLEIAIINYDRKSVVDPLTDQALQYIAEGFPSLKSLWCLRCRGLNGRGLEYLLQLPQLERLGFYDCQFSGCQVRQLGLCSTSVKRLQLQGLHHDSGWERADFLNLPNCFPSLTHVDFTGTVLPIDVILAWYANLRNLREVHLSYSTSDMRRVLEGQCDGRVAFRNTTIIFQDKQLPDNTTA